MNSRKDHAGLRAAVARAVAVGCLTAAAAASLTPGDGALAAFGLRQQGDVSRSVVIERVADPDARTATASLAGTVYDENGAVVAGASVALSRRRQRQKQVAGTDDEGAFRMESLEPGEYTLSLSAPGFRTHKTRLTLNPSETVRVAVTLDVAAPKGLVPAL